MTINNDHKNSDQNKGVKSKDAEKDILDEFSELSQSYNEQQDVKERSEATTTTGVDQ